MSRLLGIFVLLTTQLVVATGQSHWRVDYSGSSVRFKVEHMVLQHVTGRFREFTASVVASNDEFENAQVEATIQVNSVDSGRPPRDAHLRQDDFFHAAAYPTMTFKSTSITKVDQNTYKMAGKLTMRGVTRPIELIVARSSASNDHYRFIARGKLNRFDYGIRFNETDFLKTLGREAPIVGEIVEITLEIDLVRESGMRDSEQDGFLALAKGFLSSLSSEACAKTLLPYDSPERLSWTRSPEVRKGLALREMSPAQRELVDAMLKTLLSQHGFMRAKAIMSDQDVLARTEEGLGAGYFWLAIYGEPGSSRTWAWRLGGHHLSLHFTFVDNKLISCVPAFFGAETILPPDNPLEVGYKLLTPRRDLAQSLINSLNQFQSKRAIVASEFSPNLVISEARKLQLTGPTGLPISELDGNQKTIFLQLIAEYAEVFSTAVAQLQLDRVRRADPSRVYFAWAASRSEFDKQYYRIQGPDFLIEYANSGHHIHSVWRELNDFGGAGLGDGVSRDP